MPRILFQPRTVEEIMASADATIQQFCRLIGIEEAEIGEGDVSVEIAELERRMGKAWVSLARIAALEESIRHDSSVLRGEIEKATAEAYEMVAANMPKATETAKKNAIIMERADINHAERQSIDLDTQVAMLKGLRRALEIRVDMLQSINKLKVCEMDRIHAHLRTDPT